MNIFIYIHSLMDFGCEKTHTYLLMSASTIKIQDPVMELSDIKNIPGTSKIMITDTTEMELSDMKNIQAAKCNNDLDKILDIPRHSWKKMWLEVIDFCGDMDDDEAFALFFYDANTEEVQAPDWIDEHKS